MNALYRITTLVCLWILLAPMLYADIFTWTDSEGRVHYSDRPPPDSAARQLDPSQANLSTIGDAALRSDERDILERIEQRRAEELRAHAKRAAARPMVITPPPSPDPQRQTRIVTRYRPSYIDYPYAYPYPPPHLRPRPSSGLALELSGDRWRLNMGREIYRHPPVRPYPHYGHPHDKHPRPPRPPREREREPHAQDRQQRPPGHNTLYYPAPMRSPR